MNESLRIESKTTGRAKALGLLILMAGVNLSACSGFGKAARAATNGKAGANASFTDQGQERPYEIGALIYDGEAAAFGDVDAIVSILESQGISYKTVSSQELDEMSLDQMKKYGTFIWPGGYAGRMSASLQASTREKIRKAVNEGGVGFVGFCAGAFIAVSPAAEPGSDGPAWGLAIVPSNTLDYFFLEDKGIESDMVDVELADGSTRSLVWWGGPFLPDFPKGVIARYSDTGQAAIAQTWAGKGLMVIAGPHPEAPENWRTKLGLNDRDGLDQEIAGQMIQAAISQKPMPVLND